MSESEPFLISDYLCTLLALPSTISITIEPLKGGFTNHTVRAVFTEAIHIPGHSFVQYRSVIVKHAPPYIASLGPKHALSTRRQVIEARALALFGDSQSSSEDLNLAGLLHRHSHIHIPKLLHHDEEKNVIIMSDLGRAPTLLEYLAGHTGTSGAANILAEFLTDLHRSTSGLGDDALHPPENHDSSNVIADLVGQAPRRLFKSASVPDADILGDAVECEMRGEKREKCFGMVDLWPGSILMGDDFVGLIDWEYAGSSSAGSELGMLTAHLRIPLLSPVIRAEQSLAITSFITTFLSMYAARSRPRTYPFIRSALLSHGRERINAIEFQGAELSGNYHKDALIQAGAQCVRAAAFEDKERREKLFEKDDLGELI